MRKNLTATATAEGLQLEVTGPDSCIGIKHLELSPDSIGRLEIEYRATGFGDGFYSVFWGYDEKDRPAELVTLFISPDLF